MPHLTVAGALDDPGKTWWARAFGCAVVTTALGPNLGVSTEAFFKQTIVTIFLFVPLFTSMVFTTEGAQSAPKHAAAVLPHSIRVHAPCTNP